MAEGNSTFIYYSFLEEDFTSEYVNNFEYNYKKKHKISSETLKKFKRNFNQNIDNLIELVIFSENEEEDDMIGTVLINLYDLFSQV